MPTPQNPEKLNPLALSRLNLASVLSRTGMTKLTPAAIGHWVNQGCPRNADKTFNIVHIAAWLHSKYADIPYKASAATDEEKKERIALIRARRLATDQRRKIEAGKFVDREAIREEWLQRLHMIKSGLLALGRVLVSDLRGVPAEKVQAIVDARVRELLIAYAEGWDGQGAIPGRDADEKGVVADSSMERNSTDGHNEMPEHRSAGL